MKITIIGIGKMGYHMAIALLRNGHDVSVYNRTSNKAKVLEGQGAKVFLSVGDAISSGDFIIFMLSNSEAIDSVMSQCSGEMFQDKIVIQMGTISPNESQSLKTRVKKLSGRYVECPVLGSRKEVDEKRLIMMASADSRDIFDRCKDVLLSFGNKLVYVGEIGKASALKLAFNNLIAVYAVGFSTSIGIVEKNNIDMSIFLDVLKSSVLFAPMLDKKLPRWINRNYSDPNFPVRHLLKDANLVLEELKDKDISSCMNEGINAELNRAIKKGLGDDDYSAVFNAINNL